jgi:hypothetical protein
LTKREIKKLPFLTLKINFSNQSFFIYRVIYDVMSVTQKLIPGVVSSKKCPGTMGLILNIYRNAGFPHSDHSRLA